MTCDDVLKLLTPMMARQHELSLEDKKTIETLCPIVLGKEVRKCNCRDRHADALFEMWYYLKKNDKMKQKSKYVLKAGVVIQVFGDPRRYTNANLSDEVASEYLKAYPEKLNLFAVVPDEYYRERKNNKAAEKAD